MREVKIYEADDFPSYLPKLNALYDDLFSAGKGFRAKLIQKVSKTLQLDEKQIQLLSQTIEFIHNASLLHDDLIDRSELRREKTAAWLKYTPEYAVLAGDYLLARVMVNLSRYGNLELIQYTAEMISDLLEGEWIQDSLVGDWDVGLKELDRVHNLKTASLFKWCIRAPFITALDQDEVTHQVLDETGCLLGLLFQRSDDLLDFDIRNKEGKSVLGDLKSGYLNSFGSFLTDKMNEQAKHEFRQCEDMNQVLALVGADNFQQRLNDFDEMNKKIIAIHDHHLDDLAQRRPELKELIVDLKKLPDLLYWRGHQN